MFNNFSSFLSGSLRILNIANKALPLIKDISPTIKNVRTKMNNIPQININKNNHKKIESKKISNNSLTFFR
jgi:hypothetical protein